MVKDSYKKGDSKELDEMQANTYKGHKPLTLRERLEQNPALKQARAQSGTGGSTTWQIGAEDVNIPVAPREKAPHSGADGSATPQTATPKAAAPKSGSGGSATPKTAGSQAATPQSGAGGTPLRRSIPKPARGASAAYARSAESAQAVKSARTPQAVENTQPTQPVQNTFVADALAAELAEILETETQLYQDASDISTKKTEIIVKGSIEDLERLVKAEQAIILRIGQLEDQREAVISKLSEELGLNLERINLSQINSRLGEESSARLNVCQGELMNTLMGLKNKNETNEQLIQNALDYVNFSVNLMTTDNSGGMNYSPDGEEERAAGRKHLFDVKM